MHRFSRKDMSKIHFKPWTLHFVPCIVHIHLHRQESLLKAIFSSFKWTFWPLQSKTHFSSLFWKCIRKMDRWDKFSLFLHQCCFLTHNFKEAHHPQPWKFALLRFPILSSNNNPPWDNQNRTCPLNTILWPLHSSYLHFLVFVSTLLHLFWIPSHTRKFATQPQHLWRSIEIR